MCIRIRLVSSMIMDKNSKQCIVTIIVIELNFKGHFTARIPVSLYKLLF